MEAPIMGRADSPPGGGASIGAGPETVARPGGAVGFGVCADAVAPSQVPRSAAPNQLFLICSPPSIRPVAGSPGPRTVVALCNPILAHSPLKKNRRYDGYA